MTQVVPQWHCLFSFVGPMEMSKAAFLSQIKCWCPADDHVMVGNDPRLFGRGMYPDAYALSNDGRAAEAAGWRFLLERDFAEGRR